MRQYKRQGGQSIVEFAVIIPIFLLLMLAFFYVSLMCHDALTIQEIVRNSTRSLAIGSATEAQLRTYYSTNTHLSYLYTFNTDKNADPDPKNPAFSVKTVLDDPQLGAIVTVTLTASSTVTPLTVMGKNFTFPPLSSTLTMHKE